MIPFRVGNWSLDSMKPTGGTSWCSPVAGTWRVGDGLFLYTRLDWIWTCYLWKRSAVTTTLFHQRRTSPWLMPYTSVVLNLNAVTVSFPSV